jgi:hypothetical protein
MFEQVTNPKQNTDLKHLARVQSLPVTSGLWRQLRSPDNTPPPTTTTTTTTVCFLWQFLDLKKHEDFDIYNKRVFAENKGRHFSIFLLKIQIFTTCSSK